MAWLILFSGCLVWIEHNVSYVPTVDIHYVTSFAPMNNAAANGLEREAFFLRD